VAWDRNTVMPRQQFAKLQAPRPPTSALGFTLLEILVVIVIVGIIISVATIAVGVLGRDREMQDQAERLWAVLQQAKEETELQGFDLGMRVDAGSYDFVRFDARTQSWIPVADDDLLASRTLSEGLRFRLWLEGRETVLTENLDATREEEAAQDNESERAEDNAIKAETVEERRRRERPPQIMILSSGDVNSFELHLERDGSDARWRVFSKPDSTLAAEPVSNAV
jgi:general secretion pathway protein H